MRTHLKLSSAPGTGLLLFCLVAGGACGATRQESLEGAKSALVGVADPLNGKMLLAPCDHLTAQSVCATRPRGTTCPSVNPNDPALSGALLTDQTFVLGGIGGNPYDLGIHIQGEVESKRFTNGVDNDNGMQSGPGLDGLYRGGKPTTQDGYSSFLLRITGYEGGLTTDYYLNSLQPPGVSNHTTYGVDYSFVISVEGQSIVRLVAADFNCSEIANCGPHQNYGSICAAPVVVQNIEPSAQALNPGFNFTTPYNGQWLVITATDVTAR
jgi:hypothetical protein